MQLINVCVKIDSNKSLMNVVYNTVARLKFYSKYYLLTVSFVFLLLMQGCANMSGFATTPPPLIAMPAENIGSNATEMPEHYWWYARFNIPWPESKVPAWSTDLVIAHQIVNPILTSFRKDIGLWRFHRRAARDNAGHVFSFIFYSRPEVADQIYQAIDGNKIVSQLALAGALTNTVFDDVHLQRVGNVEATSDKSWDIAIQKTWPYFIMGVSESWIRLVDSIANVRSQSVVPGTTQDLLMYYAKVNSKVEELWQNQGGHAYIHHLNGLFGYGETYISERRLIRF